MKPGPKELKLRAQREAKAGARRKNWLPYSASALAAVAALNFPKSALPKPPRRAKVPKVNRGGRPKKANALTPAQKQAAYRARLKEAKA